MLSAQMANQSSFQDLIPLLSLTIVSGHVYRSCNWNHFAGCFKTQESKIVSAPTWYLELMLLIFVLNDGLEYPFWKQI
jgi:hypothetical protein